MAASTPRRVGPARVISSWGIHPPHAFMVGHQAGYRWTVEGVRDGQHDHPRRPAYRAHAVLAPAGGRQSPVRCVPSRVSAARGPARAVLCPGPRGRPDRLDVLRSLERVLRGPRREEAAQPLPARQRSPLVRHCRLQPGLQVLPELGHLQVAGDRHSGRLRDPADPCAHGQDSGLPQRRVHLQRPGDLLGVRRGRRRCLP